MGRRSRAGERAGKAAGENGDGTHGLAIAASEVVAVATASPSYVITGIAVGRLASVTGGHWAVVDPGRHRLDVWSGRPSARRVGRLTADAFSNGPLMGRRLGGRNGVKVTREVVAVVPSVAAIITYAAYGRLTRLARSPRPVRPARLTRLLRPAGLARLAGPTRVGIAGLAGVATAISLLAHWVPCGRVCSQRLALDDDRDFDGEGPSHAWFGCFGDSGFSSHAIGDGPLPAHALAGSGGLIRLIRDHQPVTGGDVARLGGRVGVAAWALVPHAGNGVIVLTGGRSVDIAGAVRMMAEVGARDAIATDPSGCSLMGAGGRVYVGPPRWHRSGIQEYGLCCG